MGTLKFLIKNQMKKKKPCYNHFCSPPHWKEANVSNVPAAATAFPDKRGATLHGKQKYHEVPNATLAGKTVIKRHHVH